MAAQWLIGLLPFNILPRLRTLMYRRVGFRGIHPRTYLLGTLDVRGYGDLYSRLRIGEGSSVNHSCHFDLNGEVSIGKNVGIGNNVLISTSTHEMGSPSQRCGKLVFKPVTIGDGAWIGSRVTIFPGVTIGPGAMIVAGAVVTKSVPANSQAAGNPARVIGWLSDPADDSSPSVMPALAAHGLATRPEARNGEVPASAQRHG